MEYIKFEKEYILTLENNSVLTDDLPLKWACSAVMPVSGQPKLAPVTLKMTLINSDPGIDRRSALTTVSFFQKWHEGYIPHSPHMTSFTHFNYNSENLVDIKFSSFYQIKLVIVIHVPKSSINPFAGYDLTEKNAKNDQVLVVEGKKFHVNKAILAEYSPFFNYLVNNDNFEESGKAELELKELNAKEFEVFLRVVYPTNVAVNVDNVEFPWKLADRFGVISVAQMCEGFLCNMEGKSTGKFSIDNRIKIAELYDSQKLKDTLYEQMANLNI